MDINEIKSKAKEYGLSFKAHTFYGVNKPEAWFVGTFKGIKESEYNGKKQYLLEFDILEGKVVNNEKQLVEVKDEKDVYVNTTTSLSRYFLPSDDNKKDTMIGKKFMITYKDTFKIKGRKNPVIRYIIISENKEELAS